MDIVHMYTNGNQQDDHKIMIKYEIYDGDFTTFTQHINI